MTREQIEALKTLALAAGGQPWKVDFAENAGDNWLVASFGADHDGKDYIVTTDYVRASEYDSDGSRAEATHAAAWSPANALKFLEAYEAEDKALREALAGIFNQINFLRIYLHADLGMKVPSDAERLDAGLDAALEIARKALGAER